MSGGALKPQVSAEEFFRLDIRLGRIVAVEEFPQARKPAYKLRVDLGEEIGTRSSSVQITERYTREELLGRRVWCVANLPPRRIGPFVSEVLVLGGVDDGGAVALAGIDESRGVPIADGAPLL